MKRKLKMNTTRKEGNCEINIIEKEGNYEKFVRT